MGCRAAGGVPGRGTPQLIGRLDTSAEPSDGDLNHPVMTPLHEGVSEAAGQPHRALHHFDGPLDLRTRADFAGPQLEPPCPFEVTVDDGINSYGRLGVYNSDANPHPVRQRRNNHPCQNGPRSQGVSIEMEIFQPGPPLLELIDLLHRVPQFLRSRGELVPRRCSITGRRGMSTHDRSRVPARRLAVAGRLNYVCVRATLGSSETPPVTLQSPTGLGTGETIHVQVRWKPVSKVAWDHLGSGLKKCPSPAALERKTDSNPRPSPWQGV